VNVSARSFQNPRLLEKIQTALLEADVDGDCLEIEITEATLMLDLDRAASVLSSLSDSGVAVAIDDFGTGYSSLSYLKRLPIHTLKIDQSFIMDVAFDKQDIAIVQSIIDLGHNLGYKVVAEGVENGMALDMLNNLGCDSAQGYHISKPLCVEHFNDWISAAPAHT
jgi:EAL domain-containing protein (putative c-di-GMP-specific phosphodiesterase class I)